MCTYYRASRSKQASPLTTAPNESTPTHTQFAGNLEVLFGFSLGNVDIESARPFIALVIKAVHCTLKLEIRSLAHRNGGANNLTMAYQWYQVPPGTIGTMETGGRVNKPARDWLDALTAPESGEQVPSQDDHSWSPQARTTTETVLREAMHALVRMQAHMLARIVVEIRAVDIAVELEPQL
jgi:hypothetical protein